jgi:hypothetical protein
MQAFQNFLILFARLWLYNIIVSLKRRTQRDMGAQVMDLSTNAYSLADHQTVGVLWSSAVIFVGGNHSQIFTTYIT